MQSYVEQAILFIINLNNNIKLQACHCNIGRILNYKQVLMALFRVLCNSRRLWYNVVGVGLTSYQLTLVGFVILFSQIVIKQSIWCPASLFKLFHTTTLFIITLLLNLKFYPSVQAYWMPSFHPRNVSTYSYPVFFVILSFFSAYVPSSNHPQLPPLNFRTH